MHNFMCTPCSYIYIYICSKLAEGRGWGGEGRGSTYKEGYLIYTVEGSPRSNSIHILLPNEYSFHTYIMNIITCNHSLQSEPEVTAGMYTSPIYTLYMHVPHYKSWFTQHINAFTCFTSYLDNGDAPGQ